MEWWPTTACTPRAPVYTPDGPSIIPHQHNKEQRLDQVVRRSEVRAEPDVEATIRFKAVSGKVDQAGGLAVRLLDHNNYYVVRANALENNVRLYRVVGGRREEFAGTNAKVTAGEWHTLSLRARGNQFTVSYDGKELFAAKDDRFGSPGKVALWTKADSVTRFDRLEIKPLQ